MNKVFILVLTLFWINNALGQAFTVTSTQFTKTEGGSQGFINVKYASPAHPHTMWVRYSLTGKNVGAVVNSDLSNFNHTGDTMRFAANDSTEQLRFTVVADNVTEGNDTFIFKLLPNPLMGSIGQPDSVVFIVRDSTVVATSGFNLKANSRTPFTKKEGRTAFIEIIAASPVMSTTTLNFTLTGISAGANVTSDISNRNPSTNSFTFNVGDTMARLDFTASMDGVTEGDEIFLFKLISASSGSIGAYDSVRFTISDSTTPTISGRPLYNIGTIRGNNKNGIPDSVTVSCTIRGTVYGVNRRDTGYQMYICDGTGCIGMFSKRTYSILPVDQLKEGDSVEISGYISDDDGWGRIQFSASSDTIRKQGSGVLKSPLVVTTALDETTESKLIKVEDLRVDTGKWQLNTYFNILMKNGAGTRFSIRVENNPSSNFSTLETIKAGEIYTITGMGSQFDPTSGNKTTGYQLLPRKLSDIVKTGTGSITTNQSQDWTVFPTVITNFMYIAYNAPSKGIADINIVDMQGKVVKSLKLALNAGEQVYTLDNLNDLPKGNYILDFTTNQARLNKIFSVAK